MSTIGTDYRFNIKHEEQGAAPKPRRSFLEKLNKRHGSLSLHMRSKRGGGEKTSAAKNKEVKTHSRTNSSSAQKENEVSVTSSSSVTSTSMSQRSADGKFSFYEPSEQWKGEEGEGAGTYLKEITEPSPKDDGFGIPFQYAVAQNERSGNQDFVQGMQEFILRKRASCNSGIGGGGKLSPVHSRVSSQGTMSEEQMEVWLEKPEDAEVHRCRKVSADQGAVLEKDGEGEKVNKEVGEEGKTSGLVESNQNSFPAEDLDRISDAYFSSWDSDPQDGDKGKSKTSPSLELQDPAERTERKKSTPDSIGVERSRVLDLPEEVLRVIAAQMDMNSIWSYRSCCKTLYSAIPTPPNPSSTTETIHHFLKNLHPPLSLTPKYCTECATHHLWTPLDTYTDPRSSPPNLRCRRYLLSGRSPILSTKNFLCESCNTVRPNKKCRTCKKCETCAGLRRSWVMISWTEDECDECVARYAPKWKNWKEEFEGRVNPGMQREWVGV